jgi:hypothetical protein
MSLLIWNFAELILQRRRGVNGGADIRIKVISTGA